MVPAGAGKPRGRRGSRAPRGSALAVTGATALPDRVTEPLRHTPLIDEHRRLGARLVPYAGWEMPVQYAGIAAEHGAVREAAGLFDVSHMGELAVRGPGALDLVDSLVTNAIARSEDGRAVYTCACHAGGGILDDLIVYRQTATELLVVCNAANRAKIAAHFAAAARPDAAVIDRSDELGLLALQGPRALAILAAAGASADVATALPRFRFTAGEIAGIPATIARTGYTGEDGVELFCAADATVSLWRALLNAGAPFGLLPVGLGARDTLRLEARLSLYGHELDEDTDPFTAGLGWVVKLDKPAFLGREALVARQARPPSRALVGFEMVGKGIARHGYALLDEAGHHVGVCTSGSPSPTLGKSIGLGYVPPTSTAIGSPLWVDCRGKAVAARVVPTPFYRRSPAV